MRLYGLPRRPIFWKLDPRTIARDDTEVRFMDARAEKSATSGPSGRDRRGELQDLCARQRFREPGPIIVAGEGGILR